MKATAFLTDMDDYPAVTEVYGRYTEGPFPARSAVQVAAHPIDTGVETEVMAVTRDE